MSPSILVLEKNCILRAELVRTLQEHGYEVIETHSESTAIALAQTRSFHLILGDASMVEPLTGPGAIEQIRRRCPEVRSIVLADYTEHHTLQNPSEVQADDYLFKPLGSDTLLETIRLTLNRKNPSNSRLEKIFQLPTEWAQGALRWAFSARLAQLLEVREQLMHTLYRSFRNQELTPRQAYLAYVQLLELEMHYHRTRLHQRLQFASAYADFGSPRPLKFPAAQLLEWSRFQNFYQGILHNRVSISEFSQSAQLYLDPDFRRLSLKNYLTYQKIWFGGPPQESPFDPFLGRTSRRIVPPVESTATRILPAEALASVLPEAPPAESIPPAPIAFLDSLNPHSAWKLLRSLFLQVEDYHRQGLCAGPFDLESLQFSPEQELQLVYFGLPAGVSRALPYELLWQATLRPTQASDQAILAFLFARLVLGTPKSRGLGLMLLLANQTALDENLFWSSLISPLQPLTPVLYRMSQIHPEHRYPTLMDAIQAIDSALNPEHTHLE